MMFSKNLYRNKKKIHQKTGDESGRGAKLFLSPVLADNLAHIQNELGNSPDIIVKLFEIGTSRTQAGAVYVDGITDKNMVNQYILHSLMLETHAGVSLEQDQNVLAFINANALTLGEVIVLKDWDSVILSVLSGNTVIFFESTEEALSGNTKGGEQRSITESSTEVVIRGPKDGFTESIGTNVSLVRRRIKSSNIRLEPFKIGLVTQTNVAIMYIQGTVEDSLVQEIRIRLQNIRIEALAGSEHLEELIQDQRMTPFPTIMNSERPDTATGYILDGRIAIFVDGTPFCLIAPATFFMYFKSVEDYYQRPEAAVIIQLLRYAALIISLFGPSIYIAAITFHQEMIPTPLLLSLAAQRESVPFPAFLEALMMEFAFEILREAGIRMPRAIGQAVSIVGALVLGQAAVEAGIVSSAMVIVVALTGISSFSTPSYNMALAIRLIRFGMMAAAALLGFYGIAIFSIFLIGHLCGLASLGVPYMSLSPYVPEDQRDTLFGQPLMTNASNPELTANSNRHVTNGEDAPSSSDSPLNHLNGSGSE
ncbi:spore germination protein [Paenibacillus prosopidis]|uniref:Spore germination protein KA n=1 Tax=Paenibacillus prosopidis TaxID=630520 RepID=A0A368VYZ0_9BACL|nr:spore germination protein [Paenibacillus prosopidis]RCW45511.1 spore germination protein KA [Paenibacillus prosopidis]